MDERRDDIGWHYREGRLRFDALTRPLTPEQWLLPVAACPGWRVRDVVAHFVGNGEDGAAGRLDGPPTPEQTAEQLARHADEGPVELLDTWAVVGPFVEDAITASGMWPAAIDVLTHEHDVRATLGDAGARDHASIVRIAERLVDGLDPSIPIAVDLGTDGGVLRAPGAIDPIASIHVTPFEWMRLRLGRRSRDQVLALDWTGDPEPFVDRLFVFGPRPDPLVE